MNNTDTMVEKSADITPEIAVSGPEPTVNVIADTKGLKGRTLVSSPQDKLNCK